jgi:hypothetical protein
MAIRYTDSSISSAASAANDGLTPLTPKRLPSDHTISSGDEVWIKGGGPDYLMPATPIPCQWSSVLNGVVQRWPGTPKPVIRHTDPGNLGTQARVFALGSGGNWTVRGLIFRNCAGACANMNTGAGTGILTIEGNEAYDVGKTFYASASGYLTAFGAGGTSPLAEVYAYNNIVDDVGSDIMWFRATTKAEFAYNRLTNPSMLDSLGDCLQIFEACTDLWVHHNYFDHRAVDSKQCFIQSGGTGGVTRFEDNEVLGYESASSQGHTAVYSDQTLLCRRNRIRVGASGIYYGANGSRIYGNVIEYGGGRTNVGAIWGATITDLRVHNNTIFRVLPGADSGEAAIRSTTSNAGIMTYNNIIGNFTRGIRRGASSLEANNCFYNVTTPVADSAGTGSLSPVNQINVDPTAFLNPDYSLRMASPTRIETLSVANPLAQAGVYVEGVALMNGRARPGMTPVGAFRALVPRVSR